MKVLFVFPDIITSSIHSGYFHYGLASLSAFLKEKRQDQVKLYHLTGYPTEREFIANIEAFSPEIIAFTATTHSFPLVKEWTGWIKKYRPDLLIGCGGVHVTICPEESLSGSELDFIVVGEGEYTLSETLNWLESYDSHRKISTIDGLWFKKDRKIVHRGKPRALIPDLDELPFCDWDLFDFEILDATKSGVGMLMLSRGCPYDCAYCCNHALKSVSMGKYTRFRSVSRAIEEIKTFVRKYQFVRTLGFDDDILPLNINWFREFCARYKKEVGYPYICNIRPNLVSDEVARLLVESNCASINVGIESGNERIRYDILNRRISDEAIWSAMNILKKHDLYVYTFNMVGIPREGKGELIDTIRLNAQSGADKCQVTIFYPYQGTQLYEYCKANGLLSTSDELIDYCGASKLKMSVLQLERVIFAQRFMSVICHIYGRLPTGIADFLLRAICSDFGTFSILIILNRLTKAMLESPRLTRLIRQFYRRFLVKPSIFWSQPKGFDG